jgi:sugar lactone lactonase YvrE
MTVMNTRNIAFMSIVVGALSASLSLVACEGDAGKDGPPGPAGAAGPEGSAGAPGAAGSAAALGAEAGSSATAATPLSAVTLPGKSFFPESVVADAKGNLYVSSAANGSVVTISADGRTVKQLIAPEIVSTTPTFVAIAKLGLYVDDAKKDLYVCTLNTQSFASTLRRYDLTTGQQKTSFNMASNGGVCNDIAADAKGNLYVTDSFFGIERLPANGTALEVWKNDSLFTAGPNQFAVDGIVVDGTTDIFVNNLTSGALIRVPIGTNDAAGTPTAIALKSNMGAAIASLSSPDGMRLRAPHTILIAESGADAVSEVKIDPQTNTAVREVFANRIDRPSSVAIGKANDGAAANDGAWIAEGQIARLFALENTPVNFPHYVKRIDLH